MADLEHFEGIDRRGELPPFTGKNRCAVQIEPAPTVIEGRPHHHRRLESIVRPFARRLRLRETGQYLDRFIVVAPEEGELPQPVAAECGDRRIGAHDEYIEPLLDPRPIHRGETGADAQLFGLVTLIHAAPLCPLERHERLFRRMEPIELHERLQVHGALDERRGERVSDRTVDEGDHLVHACFVGRPVPMGILPPGPGRYQQHAGGYR
jgi:hypothetical protein